MKRRSLDYFLADPAGNITVFITSPVSREDYQEAAKELLHACPTAEQVGFILPDGKGGEKMEMAGLEFCGNASRAFAMDQAVKKGLFDQEIDVSVSGSGAPLKAWVTFDENDEEDVRGSGRVKIEMPLPKGQEELVIPASVTGGEEVTGTLVHLEGIDHLVLTGVTADKPLTDRILSWFYRDLAMDPPAFGMMFLEEDREHLVPVVYVRDVDTVYFEGSCASGSVACGCALAMSEDPAKGGEGSSAYTFCQPAGELAVSVTKKEGEIVRILLDGSVEVMEEHIHESREEGDLS